MAGYYWKTATDCFACTGSNLAGCTTDGVTATACKTGYPLCTTDNTCPVAMVGTLKVTVASSVYTVTDCNDGYMKNSLNSACVACGAGIKVCKYTTGYATACQTGYHLTTTGTCTSCGTGIADCNLAADGTVAATSPVISAKDNYVKKSDSSGVVQCPTGAKTCTLASDQATVASITECLSGYLKKTGTSDSCELCQTGEATCAYVTVKDCVAGYFLDTTNNVCSACGTGANSCTSSSVAKDCLSGYYFQSSTTSCLSCNVGYSNVATCSYSGTTPTPLTCVDTYYLQTVTSGTTTALQCTSCNADGYGANVKKCTANTAIKNGSPIISDCRSGSFKINYCYKGITNCLTPSTPTTCKACATGYYVNSDNGCTSCGSGVKSCTYGTTGITIGDCLPGYFKNAATTGTTCDNCGANCDVCTSSTVCKSCLAGFYLTSDTPPACQSCGTGVATCSPPAAGTTSPIIGTCSDGFYLATSGTTSSCSACSDTNCKTCAGDKCSGCKNGYFIGGTKCYAGYANCYTCNQVAKCAACGLGFYWDEATLACKACALSNCLDCSVATACLTCATGYYNNNGNCTACPFSNLTNCVACSAADVCDMCADGYYWDATLKKCVNCTTGCAFCGEAASCYECLPGYYRDATNKCTACIKGCQLCSDAVNCTTCFPGYVKDATKGTCGSCYAACATCTTTAENGCASCPTNSTLTAKTVNGIAGQACQCNTGFSWDATLGKCVAGTSSASYLFCGLLSLLVIFLALI
jgi:hypothetical protein